MAAVADEVLLHEVAWPGLDRWAETPLEQILYKSRIAGDRIFQAIDALSTRRDPDPEGTAMTILLALELGFRGRYSGADDHGRIADDKQLLFALIFRARYAELGDMGDLLAGAAEPLAGYVPVRLPQLRPWSLAIVGAVACYLLVTLVVWLDQVGDVVDLARRIVATTPLLR
jgi:type VI secretion system protein ImpK